MTRATIPAKAYTDPGPVRAIPDADTLNLPLAGRFACVADGAWVDAGEAVALPTRPDALPLHAPLAGAVHLGRNLWAEPCIVGAARVLIGRARVGAHLLLAVGPEDTCVSCNLAQWRPRGVYRPIELCGAVAPQLLGVWVSSEVVT